MDKSILGKMDLYSTAEDFIEIIDEIKNTYDGQKINLICNQENSSELIKKINNDINVYEITLKYGVEIPQSFNKKISSINPEEIYIININWNKCFDGDTLIKFLNYNNLIRDNVIIMGTLEMFLPMELFNILLCFKRIEIVSSSKKYSWTCDDFKDQYDYVVLLDTIYYLLLKDSTTEQARIHKLVSECMNMDTDKAVIKKNIFQYIKRTISNMNLICVMDEWNKPLYEYTDAKLYSKYINQVMDIKKPSYDGFIELPITNEISFVMIKVNTLFCDSNFNIMAFVANSNLEKIKKSQHDVEIFFAYILSIYLSLEKYIESREKIITSEKLNVVGQIASGVVHDINNILASILGQTQILIEKVGEKELKNSVASIQNSAKDGGVIVKRIMNFSKGAENGFKVLDVSEVVKSAVYITKPIWYSRAQVLGKNIDVDIKAEKDCYVLGNEFEMREAIVNIVLNASDAVSKEGHITVKVYKRNTYVYIRISDNGKGMPSEVKSKIFNPFFSTKGKDGTGLGLSIVSETIKNMSGTIDVISKLNIGTEFIIKIPKVDYVLEDENEENRTFSFNRKLKIMVIDDQPEICTIVSEMISMIINADIKRFCSSMEALNNIENNDFDMIITDLAMPGINGMEVAKRVKQFKKSIFVTVMTGWIGGIPKDDQNMVDYVLSKPFTIDDIRNMIGIIHNLNNSKASEG